MSNFTWWWEVKISGVILWDERTAQPYCPRKHKEASLNYRTVNPVIKQHQFVVHGCEMLELNAWNQMQVQCYSYQKPYISIDHFPDIVIVLWIWHLVLKFMGWLGHVLNCECANQGLADGSWIVATNVITRISLPTPMGNMYQTPILRPWTLKHPIHHRKGQEKNECEKTVKSNHGCS
jgi:hypothetical protein